MNNFMSDRPGVYEEITAGGGLSMSSGGTAPNPNGVGDEDSDENLLFRPGGSSSAVVEREHMFEKVVTPSDVGKLNRLVIPKQHAEKYFPLDSSTNEKGLLLNFEDRNGKPWRFRYSYWNSSQSYVMTKGWSRFVKEKKLDAGDIVSFQRGVGETGKDRLFIDWRRRPDAPDLLHPPPIPHHFSSFQYRSGTTHPWSPLFLYPPHPSYHHNPYGTNYGVYNSNNVVNGNPCPPGSIFYLRPANSAAVPAAGSGGEQMVYDSVPVVQGKAAAKRLRLFGVNMDCPISESEDMLPNSTMPLHHYFPASSTPSPTSSSSNVIPNSLQFMRPNYNQDHQDKGKGSMSLDFDI